MKKHWPEMLIAALGIIVLVGLTAYKSKSKVPDLAQMSKSIVRLIDARNGHFFCSGTVIAPHMVLTAAHCLAWMPEEGVVNFVVTTADGRVIEPMASTLTLNERADIGIVAGNFELMPKVHVEMDTARIINAFQHHNLMLCGFPWGGNMLCGKFEYVGMFFNLFKGNAFAWPGMSGGPVFDLDTGKIVADLQGITNDGYIIVNPTTELPHMFP